MQPEEEERLLYLWRVYRAKRATVQEAEELLSYFASQPPEVMDRFINMPDEAAAVTAVSWQPTVSSQWLLQQAKAITTRQKHARLYRLLKITAAAAVIPAVAVTALLLHKRATVTATAPTVIHSSMQALPFSLPDGTQGQLAPHSTLTYYPPTGPNSPREAVLTGEAYFNVAKQARNAFVVKGLNHLNIQVLGTSFFFSTRPYSDCRITVQTGRICVQQQQQTLARLNANEAITVARVSGQVTRTVANIPQSRQRLTEVPLSAVTESLSHRYHLQFQLTDPSLADEMLHGGVPPAASLDETLELLTVVTSTTLTRKGNLITISRK